MENVCLLLCVVLILQVNSVKNCSIVNTAPNNKPMYQCNSIEELANLQNPEAIDVSIFNGEIRDRLGAETKVPNLQVVLLDEPTAGYGVATITALKNISQLFQNPRAPSDTLPSNLFGNLPIQIIYLEDTDINKIERGTFSDLKNLEKLYLRRSKLKAVHTGVYNNLQINTLALSNNAIEFIERNALSNMPNLGFLYFDGNRLTEFQPENFMTHRDKLEILWLSHNLLEEISPSALKDFKNLRELHLNNNKISRIFSYTFENLLNLETLRLHDNLLLNMNPTVFPENGMPKLTKMYLNNNRLSYLTNTVLGKLTKLKYIRIAGNPWQCPCLDAIFRWLGDYGVQQLCDEDYYSGKRPICVVDDTHPTYCDYNIQEFHYYRYSEANNKAPPSPQCDL